MTEAQMRLAEVRASIAKINATGQRVRKGDREVQYADLTALLKLEEQYRNEVSREAARRGRNRITYLSI